MRFLSKLSSRKFWAAAAGLITGIALVFGVDEGVINTIAGAVVAASSVVSYIVTEGRIDRSALPRSRDGAEGSGE